MAISKRFSIVHYTVDILIAFYVVGAAVVFLHFWSRQSSLIESAALREAERYSTAIEEFRTLYTSEVIGPARAHGLEVTHDYKGRDGAIPLPATLSMMLAERLGEKGGGHTTRLYSKYPFPWRTETGGLRDAFQREAWEFLSGNPDEPFFRFETSNGHPVLRFASADRMRASCVSCHNTHPQTPKNDWQEGDVRGVLEVTTRLDAIIGESRRGMVGTFLVMGFIGLLGIGGLLLVTNITRRLNVEEGRRRAAETFQTALEAAPSGMIMTNERGEITLANERAEALFGYSRAELQGQPVEMLVPIASSAAHSSRREQYTRDPGPRPMGSGRELLARHKDGPLVPVEI